MKNKILFYAGIAAFSLCLGMPTNVHAEETIKSEMNLEQNILTNDEDSDDSNSLKKKEGILEENKNLFKEEKSEKYTGEKKREITGIIIKMAKK